MSASPLYNFYKHPRFSANHLADYLCTNDAMQRERVIREAKFPKKPQVIAYQTVIPIFRDFLRHGRGDLSYFDGPKARLEAQARREIGYQRNEALRCIKAIEAFVDAYKSGRYAKLQFLPSHQNVGFKVSGVHINCRLDPPIVETAKDGSQSSGGCVLFLASGAPSRKNIDERCRLVAATVHWALESTATNLEPLGRLCLSFDVFGKTVVKAPNAFDRLRTKMAASCREVADCWNRISPPADYDGPPWQ